MAADRHFVIWNNYEIKYHCSYLQSVLTFEYPSCFNLYLVAFLSAWIWVRWLVSACTYWHSSIGWMTLSIFGCFNLHSCLTSLRRISVTISLLLGLCSLSAILFSKRNTDTSCGHTNTHTKAHPGMLMLLSNITLKDLFTLIKKNKSFMYFKDTHNRTCKSVKSKRSIDCVSFLRQSLHFAC